MEPLPRARRLYLARFFVLGGCILGLVCASTLFRPAAVEPTLLLGEGGPQGLTHGVVRGSHGYEVVLLEDADDDALLASGGYSAGASHASGFGVLKVEAAAGGADGFYAAGFLEGYLTHREIVAHAINARCEIACEGRVPPRVAAFLREQEAWTAATVAERAASDPLWRHVRDVRDQFEGVVDGVDAAVRADASGAFGPGGELSWAPFAEMLHPEDLRAFGGAGDDAAKSALRMAVRLVNSIGELIDVVPAVLHPGEREDMSGTPATPKERAEADSEALANSGRCTVLITVADDLGDIFFSHATWFHYAMMNRIYKHYSLPGVPGASQSFSSYPGTLSSFDDFYLIKETSLVILQTTNGIYNASLYGAVRPQSLPSWQRVRAANALAATGPAWASIVGRENSGTYNNQWGRRRRRSLSAGFTGARRYMILDLKLFEPGNALPDGLLYVVEQIPGTMVSGDATAELERGYFPSYNVPYFEEIYDKSGYPTLDARRGRKRGSEYQLAPRANILRRDFPKAKSLAGMRRVMRANGYGRGDPFATDPWAAVCARGDLHPTKASLAGCQDAKVGSASLFRENRGAWVVLGPTDDGQPAFSWKGIEQLDFSNATGSTQSEAINAAQTATRLMSGSPSHLLQPDTFDFAYELIAP